MQPGCYLTCHTWHLNFALPQKARSHFKMKRNLFFVYCGVDVLNSGKAISSIGTATDWILKVSPVALTSASVASRPRAELPIGLTAVDAGKDQPPFGNSTNRSRSNNTFNCDHWVSPDIPDQYLLTSHSPSLPGSPL